MDFKVVILDFDGVILESEGIKDWAFQELFKEHVHYLQEIMHYHLSHSATIRYEKFRYITEKILKQRYNQVQEQRLSREFSKLIFTKIIDCPLVPGVKDFLEDRYDQVPLYVASVNPADELREIMRLRDLRKYFKSVYASPWKKKQAIEEILKIESVSPQHTVFIGDSLEDYWAARDANVFFVGRNSGKSFQGADIPIFADFQEITKFLQPLVPHVP